MSQKDILKFQDLLEVIKSYSEVIPVFVADSLYNPWYSPSAKNRRIRHNLFDLFSFDMQINCFCTAPCTNFIFSFEEYCAIAQEGNVQANQKWLQISLQTGGIPEQAIWSRFADGLYRVLYRS